MGTLLLTSQAIAEPGELLNLSLNAQAIIPEGFVLLALIGTLLVDLAGEKTAARWAPPICYLGLGSSLIFLAGAGFNMVKHLFSLAFFKE